MSSSYQSSSSRGIFLENKSCPRCKKRSNLRSSGSTAANPFRLYYKCDECQWFQWCEPRVEEVNPYYANDGGLQRSKHQIEKILQEMKIEMKEQKQIICDIKGTIDVFCNFLRFSMKVAVFLVILLLVVSLNKSN